jgi:soluble cytochrome b562
MSGDYEALVADAQRMQQALLDLRQDLEQMLSRRLQIDPTTTALNEGLKTLIHAAVDCWNVLQAALASKNYYFLDAEVGRVTERMQKMVETMRKVAAAYA